MTHTWYIVGRKLDAATVEVRSLHPDAESAMRGAALDPEHLLAPMRVEGGRPEVGAQLRTEVRGDSEVAIVAPTRRGEERE